MNLHKSLLLMLAIVGLIVLDTHAAHSPITPLEVLITPSKSSQPEARYAAEELARYVEAMTQASVSAHEAGTQIGATASDRVIIELVVGEAAAELRDLPRGDNPEIAGDGFIIRALSPGRLRIAALEADGLLYGVYHYLEFVCGCGFFMDGDYVPQRADLPIEGIDIVELPRWERRHFNNPGSWGMTKYHPKMRTMDQRRQMIDWWAKRKLNWSGLYFGPTIQEGGTVAKEIFDLDDTRPDRTLYGGFPGNWLFPAQYQTEIIKAELQYARGHGLKYYYGFAYGTMPGVFRDRYPDLPYMQELGYDATALVPDSPEAYDWSKKYLEAVVEEYGTDHVYQCSPYTESTGAATLEESFRFKVEAAQRLCRLVKEIDPDGYWQNDTWDMSVQRRLWTAERIEKFFEALPHDMILMYDLVDFGLEPQTPTYKRTDHFYGTPWMVAFLHSFQGDEHLHGVLSSVVERIRDLSRNPEAANMEGIYNVPEIIGHNVLYFDLTTNLSWDPENVTLEGYLAEYARRRYGSEAATTMEPAINALVDAVYEDKLFYLWNASYEKYGEMHGAANYPLFPNQRGNPAMPHSPKELERLPKLAEAIETALPLRRQQSENQLFENDLLVWTKTYADLIFSWAAYDAYEAFTRGDQERLERASQVAMEAIKWIQLMLSTRPDYSLQRQIDQVMAVPGVNPQAPFLIKQHHVNWLYTMNDNYEQFYHYYEPRMAHYFATLESLADEGQTELSWAEDLQSQSDQWLESWLEESIRVADEDKYLGTTMEAISEAWQSLSPHQDYIQSIIEGTLAVFETPEDAVVYTVRSENIDRTYDWHYEFNASAWGHWMYWTPGGEGENEFAWNFTGLQPGRYELSVWVGDDPNDDHPADAPYTVRTADDSETTVEVDTTTDLRSWHKLGTFELDGNSAVTLSNDCEGNPVADSVMLMPMN